MSLYEMEKERSILSRRGPGQNRTMNRTVVMTPGEREMDIWRMSLTLQVRSLVVLFTTLTACNFQPRFPPPLAL